MDLRLARRKYKKHRNRTKGRVDAAGEPIEFKLTFEEWADIWLDSGKYKHIGTGNGAYCMSRKGDLGHYEVGNVVIIPTVQNTVDASVGRSFKHTEEAKAKIGAASRALVRTPEHCANISKGLTGKRMSDETKAKLSAAAKRQARPLVSCEICGKEMQVQNMSRHKKSRHGGGYSTAKLGKKQS